VSRKKKLRERRKIQGIPNVPARRRKGDRFEKKGGNLTLSSWDENPPKKKTTPTPTRCNLDEETPVSLVEEGKRGVEPGGTGQTFFLLGNEKKLRA